MKENPHKNPHKYNTLGELNQALIKAGKTPINRYIERRACGCAIVQTMQDELQMEFCDNHKNQMMEEFQRTVKDRPPGHYVVKDMKGAPIIEQKEPTDKTKLYPIDKKGVPGVQVFKPETLEEQAEKKKEKKNDDG